MVKAYSTDERKCNCSWSYRSGAPCRHILLIRRSKGLPLFHLSLFSLRFSKIRCHDLDREFTMETEVNNNDCLDLEDIVEDLEDVQQKILNRGEKFRLINPLAERLLEATVRCGTKKIQSYQEELRLIIENAKMGMSLFASNKVCATTNDNLEETLEEVAEAKHSVLDKPDELATDKNREGFVDGIDEKRLRFDLSFHTSSKAGRVGRPRESKVKFLKRKSVPGKESRELSRPDAVVCSFPPNIRDPKQYAVYVSDISCLRPRSFITNDLVDFQFRYMQPNGPAGKPVWLITSYLAQQLHSWSKSPSLKSQVEAAQLFGEGGCKVVFMAWCEASHFFGILGVCSDNPAIFVLESIGGYQEPQGVSILRRFMQEMQVLRHIPPGDIEVHSPVVPRQSARSNDCALFMMHSASMVLDNPDNFIQRAHMNQLSAWYPPDDASSRRLELAKLLESLGHEQRQSGQLHEFEGKLILPHLKLKVKEFFVFTYNAIISFTGL